MRVGNDKLWNWFGTSRASWLTIPRVLLHEMPDKWQGKLANLLREYEDTYDFDNLDIGTSVRITKNNKMIKTPGWLIQYRHPIMSEIKKVMRVMRRKNEK